MIFIEIIAKNVVLPNVMPQLFEIDPVKHEPKDFAILDRWIKDSKNN